MEGHQLALVVPAVISGVSGFRIWRLFCAHSLLTGVGGVHIQIFLFYGLGGLAFVSFPASEHALSSAQIDYFVLSAGGKFVSGYVLAVLAERIVRKCSRSALALDPQPRLTERSFAVIAALGIAGMLFEQLLPSVSSSAISAYLKAFSYPAIFFSIVDARRSMFWFSLAGVLFLSAADVAFFSLWRSVLVMLSATIMLGIAVRNSRLLPASFAIGVLALGLILPFQIIKRVDPEAFNESPVRVLEESLSIEFEDRYAIIGDFFAKRLDYMRELAYVSRAIDTDTLELQNGSTYTAVLLQMVPRTLWPGKPEVASWAGFELPRIIGLTARSDQSTSWAVNMFAEAAYNFGTDALLLAVPALLLLSRLTDLLGEQAFRTNAGARVFYVGTFFAWMGCTTIIFLSTTLVAVFALSKFSEGWVGKGERLTAH